MFGSFSLGLCASRRIASHRIARAQRVDSTLAKQTDERTNRTQQTQHQTLPCAQFQFKLSMLRQLFAWSAFEPNSSCTKLSACVLVCYGVCSSCSLSVCVCVSVCVFFYRTNTQLESDSSAEKTKSNRNETQRIESKLCGVVVELLANFSRLCSSLVLLSFWLSSCNLSSHQELTSNASNRDDDDNDGDDGE